MTEPNATPTRADVLREFKRTIKYGECSCAGCMSGLLAEEVARLRAERAAMIRRVESVFAFEVLSGHPVMYRSEVLAALREGGDDA